MILGMTVLTEQILLGHSSRIVPLTTDQYHDMIRNGIITEGSPIELLDGMLVRKDRSDRGEDPMSIGKKHRWSVQQLSRLNAAAETMGCHVQAQMPFVLEPSHEPEPDAAFIRGLNSEYVDRLPTASDVLSIVEVADSSLEHDRTTKLRIYAAAGIAQYVIINLAERQIENHRNPNAAEQSYPAPEIIGMSGTLVIELNNGNVMKVPAVEVIPESSR